MLPSSFNFISSIHSSQSNVTPCISLRGRCLAYSSFPLGLSDINLMISSSSCTIRNPLFSVSCSGLHLRWAGMCGVAVELSCDGGGGVGEWCEVWVACVSVFWMGSGEYFGWLVVFVFILSLWYSVHSRQHVDSSRSVAILVLLSRFICNRLRWHWLGNILQLQSSLNSRHRRRWWIIIGATRLIP